MQSDGHIHSNTGRKSTTHGIHLYIPKESATSLLGNTQVHNVTSCWRETGRRDAGTTRAPSGPRRRTGRRQHQASASAQASRSLHSMTRAKEHRCSPENKVGDLGKMNRPGFRDPLPEMGMPQENYHRLHLRKAAHLRARRPDRVRCRVPPIT